MFGLQEQKWQASNFIFDFTDHKLISFLVKMLCKIITFGFRIFFSELIVKKHIKIKPH